ncbi:MAG: hypothetical protein AAF203_01590 [Pseudomonadota bacterium]
MKNKIMLLGTIFSLLCLTGCEAINFSGTLQVIESIQLAYKPGGFNKKKKFVTLEPGRYSASIKPESKEKYFLIMNRPQAPKEKYRFPIQVPKGKDIPQYYGSFTLTASESKLKYDVRGEIDTEETQSDSRSGTDSCTYQEEVKVCEYVDTDKVCAGLKGKKLRRCRRQNPGGRQCHYESETQWGTQETEFYYEYADRNLSIEMVLPGTNRVVATFEGTDSSSREVVTWRGECN